MTNSTATNRGVRQASERADAKRHLDDNGYHVALDLLMSEIEALFGRRSPRLSLAGEGMKL